MGDGEKSDSAAVLSIGLIESADEAAGEKGDMMLAQLEELLEASTRFRVARVAGKVIQQPIGGGRRLIFRSDIKAAMESIVEIACEARNHPEFRWRAGIHTGPVIEAVTPGHEAEVEGEALDCADRIMEWGDHGHILLSKRTAFDLASDSRWNAHFYELGEFGDNIGRISLVNFYTAEVGNRDLPSKIRHHQVSAARRAKMQSVRRPALIALAILVTASAVGAGYFFVRQALQIPALVVPAEQKSIAILPLLDLSPARDHEYLSDGITEEILNAVARMKDVRVIGRASAFAFKEKNLDAREIASRLNVGTVMQGSVRRNANSFGIAVQLLNGRDGSQLWSKGFERDLREIPSVEDEIVRAVAAGLHVAPVAFAPSPAWNDPLTSDLYLQGLFLSHKKESEDLQASLDFFRLALARNPRLSAAWTNSAKDLIRLGEKGRIRPLECYAAAKDAAERALAMDPDEAEAHVYYGETKRVLGWDLSGDEAELKRALELDPHCVTAHLRSALLRTWTGTPPEAPAHIEVATKFDPYSPLVGHVKVITDLVQDHFEPAFAAVQRMMDTDPDYTYFESDLALVYLEQGKLHEALEIYLRLNSTRPQPGLAITYARLNRREDAEKILAELIRRRADQYVAADRIAAVCIALGQHDQAFEWLNRAVDEHSISLHEVGCGRDFRALRSDPRYRQLLQRIGLDPKRFPRP